MLDTSHQYHALVKRTSVILMYLKGVTGCRICDLLQLHALRRPRRTTRTTGAPRDMTIEKTLYDLELLSLKDDGSETQ